MRFLCCLLAAPALLAHAPAPRPRVLAQARSAVLVVVAPAAHGFVQAGREALRDPELAELDLTLLAVDPARQGKDLAELRAVAPALPAPGWGLFAPSGTLLGSGGAAPTAPALSAVLTGAGYKAPIKVLQAFLLKRPEHLEARSELLRLLRRGAVARTRARLALTVKSPEERLAEGELNGAAAPATEVPELLPYQGKHLAPIADLELWAPYAQELDQAFQNGTWRSLDLGMEPGQELPVEVCSPTMQALYTRHLPKVEAAIQTLPDAGALWQIWLRMAAVSGRTRSRALVQGLVLPPPEARLPWPPPGVLAALVLEAQRSGNWWLVRDLLNPFWEAWQAQDPSGTSPRAGVTPDWAASVGPLLEAMIRIRADEEATLLVNSLAMLAEPRPLVERALALAKACQRQDLARRWAALRR